MKLVNIILTSLIALLFLLVTLFFLHLELFKSKSILEAYLKDDFYSISLTLREDRSFEVVSSSMFTAEEFSGRYELLGEKIIFLDKPFYNDFIPDTLTLWDKRIVRSYKEDGGPNMDSGECFVVTKNATTE